MDSLKLLIVEDDPQFGGALREALEGAGYTTRLSRSGMEALEAVTEESFDLIIQDIHLPDADGLEILAESLRRRPGCKALVMTGFATVDRAVEAMKLGACDFLAKPFPMEVLMVKLQKALKLREMELELDSLRGSASELRRIISCSPAMRSLMETVRSVAVTDATVLITGESGTGKELVADTVHALSRRSGRPHVKLNCAAIPEGLIESELFGVEKGAFTGADRSREGYLEKADGGSLFLDEIGEMPLLLQGKLLRVLEEKVVFRVGGCRGYRADFRLITATNRKLWDMVREKGFREDLYYRLNVVPVTVPPLRERREDIPLLIAHFQRCPRSATGLEPVAFAPETLDFLCNYDYPGNVRELMNIVEQLSILHPGETIKMRHLPVSLGKGALVGKIFESFPLDRPLRDAVSEFENRYIEKVLSKTSGNKSLAARILGLSRKVLWEKLKRTPHS